MNKQRTFFLKAYDEHADALFRYCYFKLSDREAAKDAVQDIFVKIWNYLEGGKEIQHMKSFLYVTAGNYVKDQWKKKTALPMSVLDTEEEPFDVADPSANFELASEMKVALRYMEKLSESDREILTFRFVEGLPPSEIAPILGIRENAVSVRVNRALARLREIFDKHGQEN